MTIALWRAVYDPRRRLALCARTHVPVLSSVLLFADH